MATHQADGSELFKNQDAKSEHSGVAGALDSVKQAATNLWHDAYEHRAEVAATAGIVAVGAAALYANRERIGGMLAGSAKEVLLVEDTPFMGKAMKSALEEHGEKVTWLTAVNKASPLTGKTIDGADIVLDPHKFKVALVDGQLDNSSLQGEQVVSELHKSGVPTIGTSSVNTQNQAMLANGAEVAANKATVVTALIEDQLDLAGARSHPEAVQAGLNKVETVLKSADGKAMRKNADTYVMKFMDLEPAS